MSQALDILGARRRPAPPRRRGLPLGGLGVAVAVLAVLSLGVGATSVGPELLLAALGEGAEAEFARSIVFGLRLPRVLLGLVVGAGLACSGALLQSVFRNPMAEPALVGVSSGAALGAATVLVFAAGLALPASLQMWALPLAAALGGGLTVMVVQRVARKKGSTSTAVLLLAGLAMTSLVNALLGLAMHVASDAELRNLTFWLLGSLGGTSLVQIGVASIFILIPLGLSLRMGDGLDALLLGEAEAHHLGVEVERLKRRSIALAAIMVGASVAVTGVIGFVGLLVPHLVRMMVGPAHRRLLPRTALGGAGLLVGADAVARWVVAPAELPIGVLTALLGAPFFLYLLLRKGMGASA